LKVLFISKEDKTSGIHVYADILEKELEKKGVEVYTDSNFFEKFNIIHVHGRPHLGLLISKLFSGAPLISTTHMTKGELEGLIPSKLMFIAEFYLDLLYNFSSKIFVTNPNIYANLSKKESLKKKLVLMPYPVDIDRFAKKTGFDKKNFLKEYGLPNKKIVLCVASIQVRKGIYEFIETAKKLPQYNFVWVGNIPKMVFLKDYEKINAIVSGNKPNNVFFLGPLFKNKLVEAYWSADLFWLPSKSETFGLVNIEAASSGLNILLRDLPCYCLFENFAVTYKSKPEEKIIDLLENKAKFREKVKSGLIESKKYSIQTHVTRVIREYDSVRFKINSNEKIPLVSIIVPTLNEEKNIESVLKALNSQSVPRNYYEIIVSDSSSNDNTVKIAKKYSDKVVVCQRKGAGYGRNFGFKYAKGKYIGFVDGDTIVGQDWVEGLIEGLNKGVGCTGPLSNIEKDSFFINLFFIFWDAQAKLTTLFRAPIISGFNFGIRADKFKLLGGFDESNRLYEDMELSLKLSKKGKIIFSNKMRVLTSARRQKQIPLIKCVTMGLKYMFTKKSITWNEYRDDF
jgi:1,2-diacylglycerol-3-alpha-glucose alpha-1,2-galactosyltransferase